MTSVTGITDEQAARIKAASTVGAFVIGGDLFLNSDGGTQTNVGPIADGYVTDELVENIKTISAFDAPPYDITIPDWYTTSVANPSVALGTALPNGGRDVAWSPDLKYVAFGHAGSPFLSIYKITKGAGVDVFTKLANPSAIPGSEVFGVSWTPDSQYLTAVNATVPPYIITYKRSGDVFTAMNSPALIPTAPLDAAWSPGGMYLAIGTNQAGGYYVYKRDGDVLTKLTVPASPGGSAVQVNWSNGGQYLVLASWNGGVVIFKRSGDTFTQLPALSGLTVGYVGSACFSPNDKYLAVTFDNAWPGINVFKREGDTFTLLAGAITGNWPTGQRGSGVCFSPDGRYMAITTSVSTGNPAVVVYLRDGDVFNAKITAPAGLLLYCRSPQFSPDGRYLAMCSWGSSPWATINKSTLKQITTPQMPTVMVP